MGRYHHRFDPQPLGQFAGVQRTGPAERDQGEIAGIEPALDGDQPQRALHVGVGQVDDRGRDRGRLRSGTGELAVKRFDRRDRPGAVQFHAAAQPHAGRQSAQHEVCVGNSRQYPAPPVAGRAGFGTRRLRPDP